MKTAKIAMAVVLGLVILSGCNNPWSRRNRAIVYYVNAVNFQTEDKKAEAVQELQRAVEIDGKFTLGYSMLGDLYLEQKNYEQAAGAYETACRLDPWEFKDHYHLGQVYQALERFNDAIGVLKRACVIKPDSAPAQYALGTCYYQVQDYDNAQGCLAKATELDPNNFQFLSLLGDVYDKKSDPYQAINAYKQALDANPNQPEVMIKLGMVYVRQKRFEPAKVVLEKAAQASPDQPKPVLALAYCAMIEGNLDQARSQYQAVLAIKQDSAQAYNGLGAASMMLYIKNPNDKQLAQDALGAWHRSLELDSNQPKIKGLVEKYTQMLYPNTPNPMVTVP